MEVHGVVLAEYGVERWLREAMIRNWKELRIAIF